jgi:hypothetical protein
MAVNTAKTKLIVFRTRGKIVNPLDCQLVFNNNEIGLPVDPEQIFPIERISNEGSTRCFKLLGVLFDEYLAFDDHIVNLCTKVSKSLFCINKNFVTQETRKTLYSAMIHSHLVYCLSVYGCANKTSLNRLKVKQKEAIRIICNAGFRDHTAPLFARLKILSLDQLIEISVLKFMHSFSHNLLPLSFANMWQTNRNRHPERELRNADLLYIPPHKFATLNFPSVWNLAGDEKTTQGNVCI